MKKVPLGLLLAVLLLFALAGTAAARPSTAASLGSAPLATASPATLLFDNYEGLSLWNSDSNNWAITPGQAYDGTHSAHAPSSFGMTPTMIYGPFDLSAATAATLSFELMYTAPTPASGWQTGGSFNVGYSTDGSDFTYPFQWSGDTDGDWQLEQFDLASDFGSSLLGSSQVWIALQTTVSSVMSGYSAGAYVDGLTLTATIPDSTPPVTTAAGCDVSWHRKPVTVHFGATDNPGGSGVAYTEYSTNDGNDWTQGDSLTVQAPANHSGDGAHTILYKSVDNDLNWETATSCAVKIDTRGPACAAGSVTVRHSKTCRLSFKVHDALSPKVTRVITIATRSGTVKKRWSWSYGNNTTSWRSFSYRCTLPRGSYRIVVSGKDLAGNAQSVLGRAWLHVR
jgi:hypothetical protein